MPSVSGWGRGKGNYLLQCHHCYLSSVATPLGATDPPPPALGMHVMNA